MPSQVPLYQAQASLARVCFPAYQVLSVGVGSHDPDAVRIIRGDVVEAKLKCRALTEVGHMCDDIGALRSKGAECGFLARFTSVVDTDDGRELARRQELGHSLDQPVGRVVWCRYLGTRGVPSCPLLWPDCS